MALRPWPVRLVGSTLVGVESCLASAGVLVGGGLGLEEEVEESTLISVQRYLDAVAGLDEGAAPVFAL